MKTSLVLTLIGEDRPGIVEALSQMVTEQGANWEASRMARLAGRFAGILEVSVDADRAEALSSQLRALQESMRLEVAVSSPATGPRAPAEDHRRLRLDLVGNDRAGIVKEIAHALASRGVNVQELETQCTDAPMAGGTLFHCRAELSAPPALPLDELRGALEGLANDLMVEITLGEPTDGPADPGA